MFDTYLFAHPEPRPGHEGEHDHPCCTSATIDCSCGGASIWHPCDCDECMAILDAQEAQARAALLASSGDELIGLAAELVQRANTQQKENGYVQCRHCCAEAFYTSDWIEHRSDCPYARLGKLLNMPVKFAVVVMTAPEETKLESGKIPF